MIVFDLKCGKNHVFEAWFADNAGYESQVAAGEVACPVCGDTAVTKAPMAPNISTSKDVTAASESNEAGKQQAAVLNMLRKIHDTVEKNSDYVGPQFAEEARKIHYGEADKRNIHGEATKDEARELSDEGVPFSVIPTLPRTDS